MLTDLRNGISFIDSTTQIALAVKLTDYYLTISIGNRHYYFNIDDGKYDGYSISAAVINKLPTHIDTIFSQE